MLGDTTLYTSRSVQCPPMAWPLAASYILVQGGPGSVLQPASVSQNAAAQNASQEANTFSRQAADSHANTGRYSIGSSATDRALKQLKLWRDAFQRSTLPPTPRPATHSQVHFSICKSNPCTKKQMDFLILRTNVKEAQFSQMAYLNLALFTSYTANKYMLTVYRYIWMFDLTYVCRNKHYTPVL